jgi:hypothetical protein
MCLTDAATVTGDILYVDGGAHLGRCQLNGGLVMTTKTTTAEDRLGKLGIRLPELLRDVLGDQTVSSRLVFGIASLPLGSSVELEVIFEVKP